MKVLALLLAAMFLTAVTCSADQEYLIGKRGCYSAPVDKMVCRQKKFVWTYDSDSRRCVEIYGCFRFKKSNVYRSKRECKDMCLSCIGMSAPA